MNYENMLITILAEDRPGIVRSLSDVVVHHKGNWQESSFSKLSGQFAGIVNVQIPSAQKTALIQALKNLSEQGIDIRFPTASMPAGTAAAHSAALQLNVHVEANDREGIVDEIAAALARKAINIIKMDTHCKSASMAGYNVFEALLTISLPAGMAAQDVEEIVERISDDLMVSVSE